MLASCQHKTHGSHLWLLQCSSLVGNVCLQQPPRPAVVLLPLGAAELLDLGVCGPVGPCQLVDPGEVQGVVGARVQVVDKVGGGGGCIKSNKQGKPRNKHAGRIYCLTTGHKPQPVAQMCLSDDLSLKVIDKELFLQ